VGGETLTGMARPWLDYAIPTNTNTVPVPFVLGKGVKEGGKRKGKEQKHAVQQMVRRAGTAGAPGLTMAGYRVATSRFAHTPPLEERGRPPLASG
jgi:hypothetical protein